MSGLRSATLAVLVALSSGCLANDAEEFAEQLFQQNLALWEAEGPANYSFHVARGACCGWPTSTIRVLVENGVVVSRTYVSDGLDLEQEYVPEYPSLRGLFDIAGAARAQKPVLASIQYDPTYGFIAFMQFDINGSTNTDNFVYAVSEFEATPE